MIRNIVYIFTIFTTISLFAKEEFSSERFIGIETGIMGKVPILGNYLLGVPKVHLNGVGFGFRFGGPN